MKNIVLLDSNRGFCELCKVALKDEYKVFDYCDISELEGIFATLGAEILVFDTHFLDSSKDLSQSILTISQGSQIPVLFVGEKEHKEGPFLQKPLQISELMVMISEILADK